MLLGIVLVALNLRIAIAAVSPILDVVRRDVAFDDTLAGLLGAAPLVSFAVFGSLAPVVARRLGLEPTLVAALLLSATGEVVRSTTGTPAAFIAWSVVALGGMGIGNVLLPPLVKRYFPDRIGPVTAAYSMTMAFSTTAPPLLAVPLARQLGWRTSVGVWSVLAVVAVVPWCVVIARRAATGHGRRDVDGLPPGASGPADQRVRSGTGRVWRSPLAWGLAVTFGMNSLNTYALFAWLPQILTDAGLEAEAGGRWVALLAILGLPMSFAGPLLAARLRDPWPLVAALAGCYVCGYLGLALSPATGTAVWIVLLGLAQGVFPVVLALINLRTRTAEGATALSGFVQGAGYTAAAPGPVLVGVVHEVTGSWTPALAVLLVTVGVLAVVSLVACRPAVLEDTWGARPRG
ncbi:CynX/NimT family MFS transporter [Kineococcus sp. SYSU DK006]|uniref:CynX/NimT family MFS transporter n=1 Tax=Kineococcus sp. SYSU DK006 TaxID=3383127 RepID=UPI003D7CB874